MAGIGNDPNFRHFLKSLETAPTSGLGKAAEYALWINSYNALAINMVVKNPCKKSLLGFKSTRITSLKGEPKTRCLSNRVSLSYQE